MIYLLDTNVCVRLLRGVQRAALTARMTAAGPGNIAICSVVKAELLYGAEKSAQRQRNLAELQRLFTTLPSLPFDDAAAAHYGSTRAVLETAGTPIGPNDLMIACIALAQRLILVTHNVAEFSRVPGLRVEDWQQP
jgi:tRNA(fMet)-specific endonuclease VapC